MDFKNDISVNEEIKKTKKRLEKFFSFQKIYEDFKLLKGGESPEQLYFNILNDRIIIYDQFPKVYYTYFSIDQKEFSVRKSSANFLIKRNEEIVGTVPGNLSILRVLIDLLILKYDLENRDKAKIMQIYDAVKYNVKFEISC